MFNAEKLLEGGEFYSPIANWASLGKKRHGECMYHENNLSFTGQLYPFDQTVGCGVWANTFNATIGSLFSNV